MNQTLLEELKKQVLPLLKDESVELVDSSLGKERGKFTLRLLVDKPGGITLDECARLNQEISRLLDEKNTIQESYVLEISSPGLDRSLVSVRDFQRCLGQLVRIVLHQPLNKQNVWIGFVDEVNDENVVIRTEKQQRLSIARKNIARANLEVRFS